MSAANTPRGECPCGHGLRYEACCGRWHAGPQALQAPTAQALMRSRYAAFVLRLDGYLLQTWHPRTRPTALDLGPEGLRWLGLELRRVGHDAEGRSVVEFVARSKWQGRASRQHETSRFEQVDGRWYYVDGDVHG